MEWIKEIDLYFPRIATFIALAVAVWWLLRAIVGSSDALANLLGPVGKRWQSRHKGLESLVADLNERLNYLDGQQKVLRTRESCMFAYLQTDARWHNRFALMAAQHGWEAPEHVAFLDFIDEWAKQHGHPGAFDVEWT